MLAVESIMRIVDLTAAASLLEPLRVKAEANPVSLEMVQALSKGEAPLENLNEDFTALIPDGVKVTYTIEVQKHGLMRHLSVSVTGTGLPQPEVVAEFMKLLGFINPIERCCVWTEKLVSGGQAINLLEPEDGDWTPHQVT